MTEARALHYFEWPSLVRIFNADDYDLLRVREEMFVRKVSTEASSGLLDLIDASHARDAGCAPAAGASLAPSEVH